MSQAEPSCAPAHLRPARETSPRDRGRSARLLEQDQRHPALALPFSGISLVGGIVIMTSCSWPWRSGRARSAFANRSARGAATSCGSSGRGTAGDGRREHRRRIGIALPRWYRTTPLPAAVAPCPSCRRHSGAGVGIVARVPGDARGRLDPITALAGRDMTGEPLRRRRYRPRVAPREQARAALTILGVAIGVMA